MSNWIFFGFKGAGKTHLGKKLARALGRPFIDTDERMLEESGFTNIRQLHQQLGDPEFRRLEARIVRALEGTERSIIAVGGGTVLDAANVQVLQRLGQLVYLKVNLETLQRRGVSLSLGALEDLYRERLPIYEAIPAHTLNVEILRSTNGFK